MDIERQTMLKGEGVRDSNKFEVVFVDDKTRQLINLLEPQKYGIKKCMKVDSRVVDPSSNTLLLSIAGSIKSGHMAPLEKELKKIYQGRPVKLILDVQGTDAIDSSGIGELIKARTFIIEKGGRVALVGVNSRVEMMIKISGLDNYFPILASEGEAVEFLKAPPPPEPPKEQPTETATTEEPAE
jgi:anti-anti-sigma factor